MKKKKLFVQDNKKAEINVMRMKKGVSQRKTLCDKKANPT